MIVNQAQGNASLAYSSTRTAGAPPQATTTSPASVDTVSISDAARAELANQQNFATTSEQWQASLAMRRSGIPQLVKVDAAITGGVADMQGQLAQLLADKGISDASFALSYDAATQSFTVAGAPKVKAALEGELNSATPSATGSAIREGYALLDDLTSSLAAMHQQYPRDQAVSGNDATSRQQGFAYRLTLSMQDSVLTPLLKQLTPEGT